jgi:hypothetical protein
MLCEADPQPAGGGVAARLARAQSKGSTMRLSITSGARRRGRRGTVGAAALTAFSVAIALTGGVAGAASSASPSHLKTARVCADAKPGHLACLAIKVTNAAEPATIHEDAVTPNATPSGYGPSTLQAAYALPSSTAGSGQTVAIVDAYDDPNAASDLTAYRSQYALPACTVASGCFTKVSQTGSTTALPKADTGWAGEISLDLDMVSAVCPLCHILLVEATTPTTANLGTAVNRAVTMGAKFVSNSYGGAEDGSENSYDASYFNHPGVAITASSGDADYDGGSYPATSKYVTAVGGTSLSAASSARGWSEKVWNTASYTEGSGSGCSKYVAKPAFQSSINTGTCTKRAEADVSAVADPATGVAVYQTYGGSGWAVYGGTSAASPIIASVYALAGSPGTTDVPNAYPYAHTGNLNDVTSGSNGTCGAPICTAGTGWDGPTGLGTPNGVAAFKAGTSGPTPVTVANPGSKSSAVGTAVSLQLSASGGTAPYTWTATGLPTGLSISSSGLISGTPSAAGTFAVTATARDSLNAIGSAAFSWVVSTTGGGGSCSGQKLLNPGFESGATSWSQTSGVINTDSAHSHAGVGYAWLDGYGTTHTDTLSQAVTIPAGCAATLTYYLHISSGEGTATAYDKLAVSANGTTVQSFSNVNKGTGYVLRTVSLTSYAGSTVTVKWTGTEDSSIATSFFVDDTALTLS